MGSGRRPEPPELKIAKGTFRPDRDAPPLTGQPSVEKAPPPPKSLGKLGKATWKRTLRLLMDVRILSPLDYGALETYCRAYDEVERLDADIRDNGSTGVTEKGFEFQRPAVNERFKWLDIKRRYELEFGLTAASRPSVGASQRPEKTVGIQPRKRG